MGKNLTKIFKSFCVTAPSGCRMSVKSTFLLIDMKYMCKHILKIGDNHWFLIQKFKNCVKSRIMYISARFSNWHLKRDILGKMILLFNRCLNLCSEKYP